MKRLRKIFSLPSFEDNFEIYAAQMLRLLIVFLLTAGTVYALINILTDPKNITRYLYQFLFIFGVCASMFLLIRARHPQAAAIVLTLATWLMFSVAAYTGGGILSSAYIGYLVVLVIAGLLSANRAWVIIIAILCSVSGYALVYLEQNRLLPAATVPNNSPNIWLDSVIFYILVAGMQIIAARIVLDALKLAREENRQKQDAEEREKKRSALLTKVIEIGKEVTQAKDIDTCMRKIHESIQKGLQFDRVGLFLYDENQRIVRGAYGTDQNGNMEDTSWFIQDADQYEAWQIALRDADGLNLIKNYREIHKNLPEDNEMARVKEHVTLAAWAGKKPVALIAVDNVISNRPITAEKVEALRLFAGYAGLAITNAHNLEAINNELESFSYSVSHDLRSPLRAIVGFSQILMTDKSQNFDKESYSYLQKINENGRKMGTLIDDLLHFSRVGRQTVKKIKINLSLMATNIAAELNTQQPEHIPTWKIEEALECTADYNLLQQAIFNLLENAYKYSSTSPEPCIEIGSIRQSSNTIYFVRDNGIGFDIKYANKIFGVFQRLHHENEFAGTGVGLATVARTIERHNGKIWAVSEPEKGATFYFTLP